MKLTQAAAEALVAKLNSDQLAEMLVSLSTSLNRSDDSLKFIAEDASHKQKERLPLIQQMAERQRAENQRVYDRDVAPHL